MKHKIPLSSPDITDLERQAVLQVLETRRLSLGPKVKEFEDALARYVGVRHAVAVNSGTSGLHLLIRAFGIGRGDEVITTPFSFVASANCVVYECARPVFVDIEPVTLGMDARLVEERITSRTRAILAVDVFGHPADWESLREIAMKRGLVLIEDSCEALGTRYKGIKAGALGDAGTFAFYPNKQITTGEGGAIVTNDPAIAEVCASMRNQGRSRGSEWLAHERLGYNYRLTEFQSALGIAQLSRIDEILAKRARVADYYSELLRGLPDVRIPQVMLGVEMSWFVYVVQLDERYGGEERDRILRGLRERGISCSNYFPPIHLQPFYVQKYGYRTGDFPVTETISGRTIALPFFSDLRKEQMDYVVDSLKVEMRSALVSTGKSQGRVSIQ